MTTKLSVIRIYDLVKLILCIIKFDFAGNSRIMFSTSIRNMTSDQFNCFNNIQIGRGEYKIVIKSIFTNISIH